MAAVAGAGKTTIYFAPIKQTQKATEDTQPSKKAKYEKKSSEDDRRITRAASRATTPDSPRRSRSLSEKIAAEGFARPSPLSPQLLETLINGRIIVGFRCWQRGIIAFDRYLKQTGDSAIEKPVNAFPTYCYTTYLGFKLACAINNLTSAPLATTTPKLRVELCRKTYIATFQFCFDQLLARESRIESIGHWKERTTPENISLLNQVLQKNGKPVKREPEPLFDLISTTYDSLKMNLEEHVALWMLVTDLTAQEDREAGDFSEVNEAYLDSFIKV
ncbi:MAG TPA: hypothetical protein VLG44_08640 [Chlamydiales bacterium]|nr:hypothetical protein [Chlamydiales bacterium]